MSDQRASRPDSKAPRSTHGDALSRYIAVKIDVVRSRRAKDRGALQEQLFAAARWVNDRWAGGLASRFIVTHGDEVQGMLRWEGRSALFPCVEAWVDGLRPYEIRFGIGAGGLATPLRPEAIGMDGEAWHLASECLRIAHDERKHFAAAGIGPGLDRPLTALANLLLALRYGWTAKQANAVRHAETARTQVEAAQALGIAAATLSRHLSAARWDVYREGRGAFNALLEQA